MNNQINFKLIKIMLLFGLSFSAIKPAENKMAKEQAYNNLKKIETWFETYENSIKNEITSRIGSKTEEQAKDEIAKYFQSLLELIAYRIDILNKEKVIEILEIAIDNYQASKEQLESHKKKLTAIKSNLSDFKKVLKQNITNYRLELLLNEALNFFEKQNRTHLLMIYAQIYSAYGTVYYTTPEKLEIEEFKLTSGRYEHRIKDKSFIRESHIQKDRKKTIERQRIIIKDFLQNLTNPEEIRNLMYIAELISNDLLFDLNWFEKMDKKTSYTLRNILDLLPDCKDRYYRQLIITTYGEILKFLAIKQPNFASELKPINDFLRIII